MQKNSFHILRTYIIVTGMLSCILSCKKYVEVELPQNQILSEVVFSDEASARSAVTGLYSQLMGTNTNFGNGAISIYTALSSDELYNSTSSPEVDQFTNNAISPNDVGILKNRFWTAPYNYIYEANAILEGLEKSESLSADIKRSLAGEAKVVRAYCYFYLVNLFGDVPLVLSTDYRVNAVLPRTNSTEVYHQIINDLNEAKQELSVTYPSAGKVRPNSWAAGALLARVYLYLQDWSNAEAEATAIIGSGMYSLQSNFANVFLPNSTEAIWQLIPVVPGINTSEGNNFIPSNATTIPRYPLTSFLLNAFETNDLRKTNWLKSNTISGQVYYYPFKYKVRSGTTVSEYSMVVRLAEQYLIRAEARAQQNNINGGRDDLNVIRTRAGLAHITTNNKDTLLTSIEKERQTELFAEWGHRWFDLKRTHRADLILGARKPGWQSTAALYPIPLPELLVNVSLIQNPGY